MENNYYALITGASKGIGRAFAVECAKRGMNLALISLPDENLEELPKNIELSPVIKSSILQIEKPLK